MLKYCIFGQHTKKQKNKNKTKSLVSRNPRVCPAQSNVWCCAAERSVTLHGSQDRTHHNVEMLFARHYPQSSVGRRIDHSMSVTIAGAVQSLFHWPSYNNIIHSEQNHTRNITLHHSSIKANKCIVLDTSRTSW